MVKQKAGKALGVKCVDPDVFIASFAGHLKKQGQIEVPQWSTDIKTAVRKQMPPQDEDWIYTRIASVARQLYTRPKGVGVGTLCRYYGGRTTATTRKKHFSKSSRKLIRYSLQELQKLDWAVDRDEEEGGGKKLTSAGRKEMDLIASSCCDAEYEEGCMMVSSGYVQHMDVLVEDDGSEIMPVAEDDIEEESSEFGEGDDDLDG